MNHHHRQLLHTLFAHPLNANVSMKDLEHLLRALGAEIEPKKGGRLGVTLQGHTIAIGHSSHSVPREEVAEVRDFLKRCGIDAADFPL